MKSSVKNAILKTLIPFVIVSVIMTGVYIYFQFEAKKELNIIVALFDSLKYTAILFIVGYIWSILKYYIKTLRIKQK